VSRAFFNQRAAVWDETAVERDEAKLALMAARLKIECGDMVLDVGSGTGVFLPFLLSKVGSDGRIFALDIAERMLQKARAKGFGGNIVYLNADVANLPLADEVFDSAVCYSSFPHFPDKMRALMEINRVTKAGGYLFICHTSSRESINEVHNGIHEVVNDLIPDEEEMRAMLSEAGFGDIRIEDNTEDYLCQARKNDV
jgi:ubiquinone/menaquinone biosynthesis C-methylase UbiE